MFNFKKNLLNGFLLFSIFFGLVFVFYGNFRQIDKTALIPSVKAASSQNVRGFAWNANIGWISFNSLGCDTNGDGFYNDGVIGCLNDGSAVIPYGVNVDSATKELSGYAWSANIGWISFNKTDTGLPSGAPYNNNLQTYIAMLDGSNNFTGWARALAYNDGWDGWIKLGKDSADSGEDYKVSLNGNNFIGWAWGSDVTGWVSFNSLNCDTNNDGKSDGGPGCPRGSASRRFAPRTWPRPDVRDPSAPWPG